MASVTPDEERHYHLDHLGTPRLITSHQGLEQDRHTYFPYGQEATDPAQNNESQRLGADLQPRSTLRTRTGRFREALPSGLWP